MSDIRSMGSISSSLPVPLEENVDGPDYWESHVDAWSKSDLTQVEYCRQHNLKYAKFRKWKQRLKTYPTKSSIKLVEVRQDFILGPGSGVGVGTGVGSNNPGPGGMNMMGTPPRNPSGIRFWCGEFCIELDVQFSSESLSQLIGTLNALKGLQLTNSNPNPGSGAAPEYPNPDEAGNEYRISNSE